MTYRDPNACTEAIRHGPADANGCCPWCGARVTGRAPRPAPHTLDVSELTDAYGEFYDPDHPALGRAEIRDRYQLGQNP